MPTFEVWHKCPFTSQEMEQQVVIEEHMRAYIIFNIENPTQSFQHTV